MKKITLFVVLVALTTFAAHAQFLFTSAGVRAGANLTTIQGEMGTQWKPGFHVGGVIDYEIKPNLFYLQGGVYLTQKGYKSELEFPDAYTQKLNFTAFYAEVPILAVLKWKLDKNSTLSFNLGPSFNIGLFGKSEFSQVGEQFPEDTFTETFNTFSDQGFKRFDISAMMGVGYAWKQYSVHFNYDYGFLIVGDKDKMAGSKGAFSGNNIALMLTFGYTFNFYTEDEPTASN